MDCSSKPHHDDMRLHEPFILSDAQVSMRYAQLLPAYSLKDTERNVNESYSSCCRWRLLKSSFGQDLRDP